MYTLESLKKKSGNLESLSKEMSKMNKTYEKADDQRFWTPTSDKAGNAMAIIRFLPASPADGDDGVPFQRYWTHGFKGKNGKWYIEKSLTSIQQEDPVSEYNTWLWDHGEGTAQREFVSRYSKRRLSYVSNILVVNDPAKPDNNGKVFLFRYGIKIFDKINNLMNPDVELGEVPINAFDPFKGANFKLKKKLEKSGPNSWPNYDDSTFEPMSAIDEDPEKVLEICNSTYGIKEFVDPKNYESYETLLAKLDRVVGTSSKELITGSPSGKKKEEKPKAEQAASDDDEDDEVPFDLDDAADKASEDDDDELAYFNNLGD